jgi:arginyl-tRNA synthetase
MNPFKPLLEPILAAYPSLAPEDLEFGPPPRLDVGDVALKTFLAAKKLHMPPPKFAAEVAQRVDFGDAVTDVVPAGPYLNFRLKRGAFAREIVRAILREGARFGSSGTGRGHRLLIEHTSINPNASPHVGRARNAMFGDSLTRLFRFEGYNADVHYYVNDIGRQIGLLVLHAQDFESMSFDQILDAYVAANARAEKDPQFAAQGYELLAKMEEGDPETAARFQAITEKCLRGQLEVLGRLGIKYDQFDRESRFLKDKRLDSVLDALRKKDAVFTDEEQRLVVDLAKLGYTRDEGRYFVLMRANGSSMYGFRDLAYTIDKMTKGADVNLWVLGEDHKLYAEQLTLILRSAGQAAPEPIYYAHILLREGRMSTRQGKVVLLSDFLDEAARRAGEKVEEQCADLPAEERRAIAESVAISAVRFAILRVNANKNVIFDWESSLSFAGDTGPYVQYSCARINSMLRKSGDVPTEPAEIFPIEHNSEWQLATAIAGFQQVVSAAVAARAVAPIAQFVLDVARQFTTFYHDCPVLTAESDELKVARVQLCRATLQTLTNALGILGIEALERM